MGIVACLLKKIVHADIALSASYKKCWTAEFKEGCEDLHASSRYTDCVKSAIPLPLQDFVVDLHEQLSVVCRELDGADPKTHAHKLATYHAWMASPLKSSTARGPPHLLPRYLQLELIRHVLCNIAHFRLRARTLRVVTGCWQIQNRHCGKCDLHDVQDEKCFSCLCLEMCYLRRKFAKQFADFTGTDRVHDGDTGAFYLTTSVLRMRNCFS